MKRRSLCLAACLLLAGCSGMRPEDLRFTRGGRFSAQYEGRGGSRETVSGRFLLQRFGDTTRLDLMTPLNGILARIEITPQGAFLSRSADGEAQRAGSAEELMRSTVGFSLPVEAIERWMTTPEEEIAEYGWRIRVVRRSEKGEPQVIRAFCSSPFVKATLAADTF